MTSGLMRSFILRHGFGHIVCYRPLRPVIKIASLRQLRQPAQAFANVKDDGWHTGLWFTDSTTLKMVDTSGRDMEHKPPDERTLKLGKTISILHDQLPTLLASPLPQDILSPQITLHLFPSTHPHLPTVSGRIAYSAALWTAPVAWGRVPVVGNVRLVILSERMVKNSSKNSTCSAEYTPSNERLIVRWKTSGKTKGRGMGALYRGIYGKGDQVDKITEFLGGDVRDDQEFEGLFIFEFDSEGRIVSHTIEHAQQGSNWEKMTRVVNVTDWLLGRAKWRKDTEAPSLALECEDERSLRRSYQRRTANG